MDKIILETERLLLREITPDDLDDLLKIWGDPETMRLFPKTLTREQMLAWIERNQNRYTEFEFGLWGVCLKSDRQFVGDCGLVLQDVADTWEIEMGYHFNKNFWGRGLATEAARGCLGYAFDQLNRHRIISMIRPENLASQRVAMRNGLEFEKQIFWRGYQHEIYGIEREKWRRSKPTIN